MKAWEELTGLDPLIFPIGGKDYTVPPATLDQGLLVLSILNGKDPDWAEKPMTELFELVLGDTWQQMRADGVPLEAANRAGFAAVADIQEGREAAEAIWESSLNPEALAAQEAAKTSATSTGTASENETPQPASTTATTSPPATRRRAQKTQARRSAGKKSSTSGT
jgi:hypothetical protein